VILKTGIIPALLFADFYYFTVFFDQINAALVSIKDSKTF